MDESQPQSEPNSLQGLLSRFAGIFDPTQPLGLPENTIRGLLTMMLVGGMLYMQWQSPKDGAVPAGFVALASGAAGYYLGNDTASASMRALLSIIIIGVTVAFYMNTNWLPESVNALAAMAFGIYFSKRTLAKPDGPGTTATTAGAAAVGLAMLVALPLFVNGCSLLPPKAGDPIEQDIRVGTSLLCALLPPAQQDAARDVIRQARHWTDVALYDHLSNPTPGDRASAIFAAAWYYAKRYVDAQSISDVEEWKAAIGHQLRVAYDACEAVLPQFALSAGGQCGPVARKKTESVGGDKQQGA